MDNGIEVVVSMMLQEKRDGYPGTEKMKSQGQGILEARESSELK